MKTIKPQNIFKVVMLLSALFFLAGCGASKSSNDGFDAASTDPGNGTTDDAIASCSKAEASGFGVKITQFKDQYGVIRPEFMRIKITSIPAEFKTEAWKLSMYRWTVVGSAQPVIEPDNILNYEFERALSPAYPLIMPVNTVYTRFNGSQILGDGGSNPGLVPYANQNSSTSGYPLVDGDTAANFFADVTFKVHLNDSTNSFQVIRLVLRNSAGTVDHRTLDVLIPTFKADPNRYAAETLTIGGEAVLRHPALLQSLHPLFNYLGETGISQASYYEFARTYCF